MHTDNAFWRRRALALAALSFAIPVVVAQAVAAAPPTPGAAAAVNGASVSVQPVVQPADDAPSYSIGLVFGSQLRSAGLDAALSFDAVMRGFRDGMGGKLLGDEDKQRAMQLMRSGRENLASRNHAAAQEFLAKNGAIAGVTTTASGLQYQVFSAGDATVASPSPRDRVTVNYRGRLLDGTEFDNSDNHPQAATFAVDGVIGGWREALPLMKPGARWRLFVPPELGYDLNSPPNIPPGSMLIFDVELLKIEPPGPLTVAPSKHQQGASPSTPSKPVAPKLPVRRTGA